MMETVQKSCVLENDLSLIKAQSHFQRASFNHFDCKFLLIGKIFLLLEGKFICSINSLKKHMNSS